MAMTSDVHWRPATSADAPTVGVLFQTIAERAPAGLETILVEVESRLAAPRLDLARDTLVGAAADGDILAYAEAADMGVGQGQFRIRLTNAVHPSSGEHIAQHTHRWLLDRAGLLHRERHPELPAVLGARCAAGDTARLALLAGSGFEVVRWQHDLVRLVDKPLPPIATPPDIAIVRYEPEWDEAARVAHNDAYADSPSALLPDRQSWPTHAVGLATFLPDASFLALADERGEQVIAAFLYSLNHTDTTGEPEAALHCLGTRAPWRRRGLARALIGHAWAAYQQAGCHQVRLQVASDNPAAITLYQNLGFNDSGRSYAILQAALS